MTIAFGISSLFFAILGVFVPLFGVAISGFSGFLAWMSTGKGYPLGAAAIIINLANIFFMSPGYMLAVNMESQLRNYDQQKMFLVWLIVFYLQVSAIGVFIINYLLSMIDFSAIFTSFKNKKEREQFPNTIEQAVKGNSSAQTSVALQLETKTDDESDVILLADQPKAVQSDEAKGQDRIILKNETNERWRNLEDLPFDGSRPHERAKRQNRAIQKGCSIAISCVLVAFVIVYLRPDLFTFLTYSNIYSVVSKTFPERNLSYFQKPKDQLPPSEKADGHVLSPLHTPTKRASVQSAQLPPGQQIYRNPISDYWYIIELKSGETILTQDAVITKYYVSVLLNGGEERRISKADMKSYVRRKI